jgi:hypothetical protein
VATSPPNQTPWYADDEASGPLNGRKNMIHQQSRRTSRLTAASLITVSLVAASALLTGSAAATGNAQPGPRPLAATPVPAGCDQVKHTLRSHQGVIAVAELVRCFDQLHETGSGPAPRALTCAQFNKLAENGLGPLPAEDYERCDRGSRTPTAPKQK